MDAIKHPFFLACAALFLALSMTWSVLLPIHEAPDEQNHYRYMMFIKENSRLARQLPLPPEVAGEGHQPPLYYALGALVLKVLDPAGKWVELPDNPGEVFNNNADYFGHYSEEGFLRFSGYAVGPHIVRLFLMVFPLASLAVLWVFLCGLAGPASPVARFGLVLAALNPGWVALSASLNNDHAVTLFFSLAVALFAWVLRGKVWNNRFSVVLGLVLGLGALSEISILCLLPVAAACLWWAVPARNRLKQAAILSGVFLAVAGWFYARNQVLYGDPWGWRMHLLTCANTVHAKSLFNLRWWLFWLRTMFESYWAVFGWFTWAAPAWVIYGFALLTLAALAGLGLRAKSLLASPASKPQAWMLLACLAGLVLGVVKFNLAFDPPEGRYLYPALLPIAAALGAGISTWIIKLPNRAVEYSGWAAMLGLAALDGWLVLFRLVPLYYRF